MKEHRDDGLESMIPPSIATGVSDLQGAICAIEKFGINSYKDMTEGVRRIPELVLYVLPTMSKLVQSPSLSHGRPRAHSQTDRRNAKLFKFIPMGLEMTQEQAISVIDINPNIYMRLSLVLRENPLVALEFLKMPKQTSFMLSHIPEGLRMNCYTQEEIRGRITQILQRQPVTQEPDLSLSIRRSRQNVGYLYLV